MVAAGSRQSFVRDQRGISLTEGMIAFPIVVLMFATFVEFGFAVFQWNQTAKALHLGARLIAVSDPMVNLDPLNPAPPSSDQIGSTMPAGATATCSGQTCIGIDRLLNGNGRWPGLRRFNPRIRAENIVVTYERSGLGYYGRPGGPVVTIGIEVTDLTLELPVIGALLGLQTVTVPPMRVTVTSEDMSTSG